MGSHAAGKAQLDRAAHLTAVQGSFTKVVITAPKVRMS